MTICSKCEGRGFITVRNPDYKVGSLSFFLKKQKCRFCGGKGQISTIVIKGNNEK